MISLMRLKQAVPRLQLRHYIPDIYRKIMARNCFLVNSSKSYVDILELTLLFYILFRYLQSYS
jgi:hypothetical protein